MTRCRLRALGLVAATIWLLSPACPAWAGEYVLDEAAVIDAGTEARIEALSLRVEQETPGAEIAVLTVDAMGGQEVEEYAEERFERLGVGSSDLDNGVLLVVAMQERRMRIEVGYGLEGAIPDSRAGRIIDDILRPAFQSGDFSGGIEAAHAELARLVLEEYGKSTEGLPVTGPADTVTPPWVFTLVIFGGMGFFMALLVWLANKGIISGGPGSGGYRGPTSWGGGSSSGGSSSGGSSDGGGGGSGGFGGGDSGGGGASGGW